MISNFSLRDIVSSLFRLVAPEECVVCGRELSLHEKHLCIECLADLPKTHFSTLSRNPLSDRFNELVQRDLDDGYERYAYATALFFYRSGTGYRRITQRLKYQADFGVGKCFSSLLGREMASSPLFSDVDVVIPVPLHPSRRWSRGYNQAETIAGEIAACLGVPMRTDMLRRVRRTKSQTKLSVEEKASNVKTAFMVKKGGITEYSHILLVDDVFTTGATLYACFCALRRHYLPQTRISVATLAAVGK